MNDEKEELTRTMNDLKSELDAVSKMLKETTIRADKAEYALKEAEGKIEWYKGQIEAYQYCMNCRR